MVTDYSFLRILILGPKPPSTAIPSVRSAFQIMLTACALSGSDVTHNQTILQSTPPKKRHEPLQVPKYKYDEFEFIPFERRRRYHAMVSYMDDAIDDLVTAYKQNSLWENTLMVFSADNGGPIYRWGDPGANNFPLRGGKASNWEGGIRVNAFVAGGALPSSMQGTKATGLVALWDWYECRLSNPPERCVGSRGPLMGFHAPPPPPPPLPPRPPPPTATSTVCPR